MKFGYLLLVFMLFTTVNLNMPIISAQDTFPIQCGESAEAELTTQYPVHNYVIELLPGDTLITKVTAYGDSLDVQIRFYGPSGSHISSTRFKKEVELSADLGATGEYGIQVGGLYGAVGVYFLQVSCVLRDGTVINPGDTLEPIDNNSSQPPTFSGVGFPGLASMDFINGVTIPFTQGVPNTGSIAQGFDGVFGFTLDVNAGETYTFDFSKISGNLNLAIAILSPDNQIVFYGSMITSNRLSTDVLFPAAGQYTIGVYRVDFMPPGTPENTAFQVTATLQ